MGIIVGLLAFNAGFLAGVWWKAAIERTRRLTRERRSVIELLEKSGATIVRGSEVTRGFALYGVHTSGAN